MKNVYPTWSGISKKYDKNYLAGTASVLITLCQMENETHNSKAIRYLHGGICHYLERIENFKFGISVEAHHWISKNLNSLKKGSNPNPKMIRMEHAIPMKIFIETIKFRKNITPEELIAYIRETYSIYLITLEEDMRLNSLKLREKTPDNMNIESHGLLCRYEYANINILEKAGKESS